VARDLELAADIVLTVMDVLMNTSLGDMMMDPDELKLALGKATVEVADLLDPDEKMDVEITDEEMDVEVWHGRDGSVAVILWDE
jgi:hypothetical protein